MSDVNYSCSNCVCLSFPWPTARRMLLSKMQEAVMQANWQRPSGDRVFHSLRRFIRRRSALRFARGRGFKSTKLRFENLEARLALSGVGINEFVASNGAALVDED